MQNSNWASSFSWISSAKISLTGGVLIKITIFVLFPHFIGVNNGMQCSHKVRFSRTLVRNRTFWSKLVRERSDFALKSPILKAWVNINLSIVQYCFQTVVQLSVISESVHIPSSKLILTGMNTNYLAPSRGAQLCLKSCFKAISSHGLISINFCHIWVRFWSDFNKNIGLI